MRLGAVSNICQLAQNPHSAQNRLCGSKRVMAFYEKVVKVKADVAAYLN